MKIGTRGFLRTFVYILDKAERYEDYILEEQFIFSDDVMELAICTECENAHRVNFWVRICEILTVYVRSKRIKLLIKQLRDGLRN